MGCADVAPTAIWLAGKAQLDGRIDTPSSALEPSVDLADVIGQSHARFAVEVAAAGAMSKVTLMLFYAHPIRSHRNLDMPIS